MAYRLILLKPLPYIIFDMHIKKSSITWLDPTTNITNIGWGLLITSMASFPAVQFLIIAILDYLGYLYHCRDYRSNRDALNNRYS